MRWQWNRRRLSKRRAAPTRRLIAGFLVPASTNRLFTPPSRRPVSSITFRGTTCSVADGEVRIEAKRNLGKCTHIARVGIDGFLGNFLAVSDSAWRCCLAADFILYAQSTRCVKDVDCGLTTSSKMTLVMVSLLVWRSARIIATAHWWSTNSHDCGLLRRGFGVF